jgi:hypothetical protein
MTLCEDHLNTMSILCQLANISIIYTVYFKQKYHFTTINIVMLIVVKWYFGSARTFDWTKAHLKLPVPLDNPPPPRHNDCDLYPGTYMRSTINMHYDVH